LIKKIEDSLDDAAVTTTTRIAHVNPTILLLGDTPSDSNRRRWISIINGLRTSESQLGKIDKGEVFAEVNSTKSTTPLTLWFRIV
jgi:hypothetical protein